eukprot:Lankesteria_metandrocarpae@DN423_c0_g1_i1.p1
MDFNTVEPMDVMMLERSSVELKTHIKNLKKSGIMTKGKVVDEEGEMLEDPESLFYNPVAQMAAKSHEKGLLGSTTTSDSDNSSTESSSDSSDDMCSDEADDDIGDLPDLPQSYMNRKPRHSVSAEVYGEFNKKQAFVPPTHAKTFEERNGIMKFIHNVFLFSTLESRDLETVINAMEKVNLEDGNRIIDQGDDGDALYVIAEGTMNVFKIFNFTPGNPTLEPEVNVKVCKEGDVFGELALLYNCPRAASVQADGQALLWKLDRETFTHIVKDAATKKRDMYEKFLSTAALLKECDSYERSKIADALKTKLYKAGEKIITQDELGDTFYFVESGEAVAVKSFKGKEPVQTMKYQSGDYFGELAILRNAPRAATIEAVNDVMVAYLNRQAFKRLLGPMQTILERNAAQYKSQASEVVTS